MKKPYVFFIWKLNYSGKFYWSNPFENKYPSSYGKFALFCNSANNGSILKLGINIPKWHVEWKYILK